MLRQIFQRTLDPYLKMVKSFLFTGDFDDFHEEFFIKKIYRKSSRDSQNSYDDYVFMMTPDLINNVPCFMTTIAHTI